MRYKIVRFYEASHATSRVMARGLTLEQAQAHCSDPNTRGVTRIRGIKTRYFDGYDKD